MAPSETNHFTQYLNVSAPIVAFFISGLIIHSFIVGVNISDHMKGKSMTAAEKIITSLGISRLLYQLFCMADMLLSFLFQNSSAFYIIQVLFDFIEFSTYYNNIWLLTLLSVTFCLKISNFQRCLFLYLTTVMEKRIRYVILGSVLMSITKALTVTSTIYFMAAKALSNVFMQNNTHRYAALMRYSYILPSSNIIPFLIHGMSSALLIVSLLLHLHRMKGSKNRATQLHPIYAVINSSSYSLVSYGLQVLVEITVLSYLHLLGPVLPYLIWTGFQCAHSVHLIISITKLRNKLIEVLHRGFNYLCNGRMCESRT